MSVEVEVGPQGATYFWGVDDQAREHSNDVSRTQIESLTRRLVSAIAARVQGSNPGWRRQYLQG
ncbi:hypothetical protein [Kocuria marina]|uniref:hypothetical protein n=1 Tax=Kocuria marina TaxID=223184 RepID=UPI00223B3EF6|nr:hypothetical protein [Kocuria marina]MCT1615185.1 hypothetical protein [Kocuria marina]